MKISGQQPSAAKELTTGQTKSKDDTQGSKSTHVSSTASGSVKTSEFAMDKIKNKVSAEPEVRADRVAEMKAKIAKGEYQIDFQKLAGKMLTDSLREDV